MGNFIAHVARPLKNGANPVSLWVRKLVERTEIKELIGIHLAGITFFSALIVPQTANIVSTVEASRTPTPAAIIDVIPTTTTFQWPLTSFDISQRFSIFHPGIDLVAPRGTPILAASEGEIAWVNFFPWGYGNHVLIKYNNRIQSLYAHMSKILVQPGQEVTKQTEIGEVGATGWATGNHLHFEVYQDGTPINPLDVLPETKY